MLDPNSHTWFEACGLSLRVEAQAQRIAVMITNNPLGLPGSKDPERPQKVQARGRAGRAVRQ
jgi:hypothetical protein